MTKDADLLSAWSFGNRRDISVCIAKDEMGNVLGVAATSERKDLLSHAPNAHLEVCGRNTGTSRVRWAYAAVND